MEDTRKRVGNNYPHWCDYETGKWTTTVDGDWTGWPPSTQATIVTAHRRLL
jgi:unsaturated chondroitin disaccharide hydrolase